MSEFSKRQSYNTVDEGDEEVGTIYYEVDDDDADKSSCCGRLFPAGFWAELKKMFVITWPICLTQVCQMIIGPISLIFCGHLGDPIKLDGAALAISMINATCISVGQGLGTACDTFYSQTYGSPNRRKMGLYLQRALFIFFLALLVCFAVQINMELILRLFGQHPEVSRLAGRYMIIFMPGALGFFLYIILAKYVQNQNIVMPNVVIGLICNAVNAILHYVFLYQMNMDTDGSAIAQSISYVLMFVLTLGYILVSKVYKETWEGWSWDCLQDWGTFCRLAIPGMLMVCLEWWGFEIGVFLTGVLGTTELGAQSVLLQIDSIWFQIPLGIQIACSIRVGQYLGSGNADGAVTAARLAITVVFIISVVVAALFLGLRYQLPYVFTNVEDIAQLTGDLLPIVTLYIFFDGIATACKGVLYGTGRQIIGAVILFISYYCLSLPIGIPLMFLTDLRSAAYWLALAINMVIQTCVLVTMVTRTDWNKQIMTAKARLGYDSLHEDNAFYGDEDTFTEKTGLLSRQSSFHSPPRKFSTSWPGQRVSRLHSTSLSQQEIQQLLNTEPEAEPLRDVLFKRGIAASIVFGVFIFGLAISLMVKLPEFSEVSTTTDSILNQTLSLTIAE